jgi:hypothetical protein
MSEPCYVVEAPGEIQARHQSEEDAIKAAQEYLKRNPNERKVKISEVGGGRGPNATIVYYVGGVFHISRITPVG